MEMSKDSSLQRDSKQNSYQNIRTYQNQSHRGNVSNNIPGPNYSTYISPGQLNY